MSISKTEKTLIAAIVALLITMVAGIAFGVPAAMNYLEERQANAADAAIYNNPVRVEGAINRLERYRYDYKKEHDSTMRDIIKTTALREADEIDERLLPPDLRRWVRSLRR